MKRKVARLDRGQTVLAVVDIQERLVPAMHERDRLLRKALQLIRGCALLGVPIVATEQYPRGLGPTVKDIADAIPSFSPIEKLEFSACGAPEFVSALRVKNVTGVLVAGIESHVCVTQTCLALLEEGFEVFVAADATSSRSIGDWRAGIERARAAGAVIVSVEMVLFELLRGADSPRFKEILQIVK